MLPKIVERTDAPPTFTFRRSPFTPHPTLPASKPFLHFYDFCSVFSCVTGDPLFKPKSPVQFLKNLKSLQTMSVSSLCLTYTLLKRTILGGTLLTVPRPGVCRCHFGRSWTNEPVWIPWGACHMACRYPLNPIILMSNLCVLFPFRLRVVCLLRQISAQSIG